jgi:16S rRNA (guanine527-N7)-methyltransferase
MDPVKNQFFSLMKQQGMEVTEDKFNQFESYFALLTEWNQKMNLTAITDREGVYVKHFYDSVSLAFYFDLNEITTLADIGAGAGFPSFPLKIFYPHLKVTIVESLKKRLSFLHQVVTDLGLTDVELIHGRAEDVSRNTSQREKFDLVTARAVARLNVLSEFCLPFVRLGGYFIAMKGAKAEEEIQESAKSFQVLGGRLIDVHSFILPLETSQRQIILIKKDRSTPNKYPRQAGTPLRSPIN